MSLRTKDAEVAKWTVLIVDDDPGNRGVADRMLSMHGAEVHTANDGVEALKKLNELNPTVILSDISMPNMDGWELIENIRKSSKTKKTPVVAITAHAMDIDKKRIMEAGFDGFISKPYWLATFLNDIKCCVKH